MAGMDLDRIQIASPCKADWEQLMGDAQVPHALSGCWERRAGVVGHASRTVFLIPPPRVV
jgi:hypothetical protein